MRGHYRILLGMAAGVGKTYRMLQEGRQAADEERLERLRRELDDAVALDASGPASLEVGALGAEHAQLQCPSR